MGLNKVKGNMYSFLNEPPYTGYTWNPIRGKCMYACEYCFMKDMAKRFHKIQSELRLDEKDLKTKLGSGNFIFVGSSCDMFAENVPPFWIVSVLLKCFDAKDNRYLFQSKNPKMFLEFASHFSNKNIVLGTTIESNRNYPDISKAPLVGDRAEAMEVFSSYVPTIITIEPILDFDVEYLVGLIGDINPTWVNIGADSGGHGLPEPSAEKIGELIKELEQICNVKLKDNLRRLYVKPKI